MWIAFVVAMKNTYSDSLSDFYLAHLQSTWIFFFLQSSGGRSDIWFRITISFMTNLKISYYEDYEVLLFRQIMFY